MGTLSLERPHRLLAAVTTAPRRSRLLLLAAALSAGLLACACADMPTGPMVAVMPGPNKPFEVFVQDDAICRGWASHAIGLPGNDAAARQMLGTTAAGVGIGAVAGALIGGDRGAGAGAAMGTVVGASAGAGQSAYTAVNAQRRYDIAYLQCMYAKGNPAPGVAYPAYGWSASPGPAQPPPSPLPPRPPAQIQR